MLSPPRRIAARNFIINCICNLYNFVYSINSYAFVKNISFRMQPAMDLLVNASVWILSLLHHTATFTCHSISTLLCDKTDYVHNPNTCLFQSSWEEVLAPAIRVLSCLSPSVSEQLPRPNFYLFMSAINLVSLLDLFLGIYE